MSLVAFLSVRMVVSNTNPWAFPKRTSPHWSRTQSRNLVDEAFYNSFFRRPPRAWESRARRFLIPFLICVEVISRSSLSAQEPQPTRYSVQEFPVGTLHLTSLSTARTFGSQTNCGRATVLGSCGRLDFQSS